MKIVIFTLSWNGLNRLQMLSNDIMDFKNALGLDIHWYIRDNDSKDGTVAELNSWKPFPLTVFDIGHNRDSFSQGMNYLAAQANPADDDLILLLNNDVKFNDINSLTKMIKLMTSDVAIVGARLTYPGTNILQHAGTIFSDRYGKMPYHLRHKEKSNGYTEKNRYFQAVTAACCLIRAKEFKAVGGFDERYRWAFEDVDLNLKIGQLGKKIVYCGQTDISHEESVSLVKNPVNKLFLSQNVAVFQNKWWNANVPKYKLDHDLYLKDPHYNEIY